MPNRSRHAASALAHLPEADPALAALALWCQIEDSDGPTKTVGHQILVGRDFCGLPLREQIGLIGHHILHAALQHGSRKQNMRSRTLKTFQPETFNLAADAVVNEVLVQAGHALPRPAPLLSELLENVLQQDTNQALRDWDVGRLYVALMSQDEYGKARQKDYETQSRFQRDLEVEQDTGKEKDAAEWQGHLSRAAHRSGAGGRGIGTLLQQLADCPLPATPWELRLRRLLAKAVSEVPRLNHRRPAHQWIAADAEAHDTHGPSPAFQPGQSRRNMRMRIVVGIDSSGSISTDTLALFSAEVSGIARRTGAEVHALYFDELRVSA